MRNAFWKIITESSDFEKHPDSKQLILIFWKWQWQGDNFLKQICQTEVCSLSFRICKWEKHAIPSLNTNPMLKTTRRFSTHILKPFEHHCWVTPQGFATLNLRHSSKQRWSCFFHGRNQCYLPVIFCGWRFMTSYITKLRLYMNHVICLPSNNRGYLSRRCGGRGGFSAVYLEDHPRTCKWLGSPPFMSHEWPFGKGNNPT